MGAMNVNEFLNTAAGIAQTGTPTMIRRTSPEVLAPAGNLKSFKAAVDFGADAVYCSGKMFGMRSAPKNLSLEEIAEARDYAHARGARIYITCNILPHNEEIAGIREYIGQLADIGVDAIIVTDIGVMMMAHRIAPDLELHVSTQAGVTNWLAANELHELGAKRVVLARELSLDTVRGIRANVPDDLDIEAFVHGSMCMAFSGRCLISNYLTGRDGNHGECAQPCRWKYHLVEEKRPGQYFPIEETDKGSYIFNSQDMCMLEHVGDVIDAGVTSLKIEGRAKSVYYISAMTNAYKCAVNLCLEADDPRDVVLPEWLRAEPYKVSHRDYSTGFWYPEHKVTQNADRNGYYRDWVLVGETRGWADGRLTFMGHNKITPGQTVEILRPGEPPVRIESADDSFLDADGVPVAAAAYPTRTFSMACPEPVADGLMMRSPAPNRTLKAE